MNKLFSSKISFKTRYIDFKELSLTFSKYSEIGRSNILLLESSIQTFYNSEYFPISILSKQIMHKYITFSFASYLLARYEIEHANFSYIITLRRKSVLTSVLK